MQCHFTKMKTLVIITLLLSVALAFDEENVAKTFGGTFGRIKEGLKLAGKLLGLDEASGVANLVTSAFRKTNRKDQNVDSTGNGLFSGFLRILGFNGKKVGAIAVNALIFVAQLISSALPIRKPSQLTQARQIHEEGTPLDWLLKNSQVAHILDNAKKDNLTNQIIIYIKEHSLDEDSDCIQLLVCKSAPLISGMQKALKENGKIHYKNKLDVFFAHMPSLDEITDHGDLCETQHPYCLIHD